MNHEESSCRGLGPIEQGNKKDDLEGGVQSPTNKARRCSKETVEHKTWRAMKARCLNPSHQAYDRYGGRGISVCERWMDFESFLSDMGRRPIGKTLDRINNNRGYSPDNCRWATWTEQQRNRRDNVSLTIGGIYFPSISAAAEHLGLKRKTLERRVRKGWSVDRLPKSTEPVRGDDHPGAKMTYAKAEQLRLDAITLKGSGISTKTLMEKYGIKKSLVAMIISRKVWS